MNHTGRSRLGGPVAPSGSALWRGLLAWVLLSAGGLRAPASLVVFIPTRDGLVVAAESRTQMQGKVRDNYEKIFFLEDRPDLAYALTGITKLVRPIRLYTRGGVGTQTTLVDFDGADLVRHYLTTRPSTALTKPYLQGLGRFCAIRLYEATNSAERKHWANTGFCAITLGRHQPATHLTEVGTLVLLFDAKGRPYPARVVVDHYALTNRTAVLMFGVRNYVRRHVLNGVGKAWLSPDFLKLQRGEWRIGELSAARAARLAGELIRVTARTSQKVPIPKGITLGGRIRAYQVDGRHAPVPLDAGPPIPARAVSR